MPSFDVVQSLVLLAQHDHAEHRDEQQESQDLHGQQVGREELVGVEFE